MAILLTSANRTASGTSGTLAVPSGVEGASVMLDVTAAATLVGDTLNVRVQSSADDGSTWDDFISFTQVLGNGGAKQYVATWSANALPDSEIHAVADGTLAAGNVLQGPTGGLWRVKYTIAGTGNFTFSVDASFNRDK